MKLVKNFVFAVVLVSALAVNTFAGELETPGFVPPPPPRVMTVEPNEVPNDGTPTEEEGESAYDYLLIDALQLMLSVF